MTDTQIEAAARRLCAIRGIDPDEKIIDRFGDDAARVYAFRPRWWDVKREVKEAIRRVEVQQAIRDTEGWWACPACGKYPAVPSVKGNCCTECANAGRFGRAIAAEEARRKT